MKGTNEPRCHPIYSAIRQNLSLSVSSKVQFQLTFMLVYTDHMLSINQGLIVLRLFHRSKI